MSPMFLLHWNLTGPPPCLATPQSRSFSVIPPTRVNFRSGFEIDWNSGVLVAGLSIWDIENHNLTHAQCPPQAKILGIFARKNAQKQISNKVDFLGSFSIESKTLNFPWLHSHFHEVTSQIKCNQVLFRLQSCIRYFRYNVGFTKITRKSFSSGIFQFLFYLSSILIGKPTFRPGICPSHRGRFPVGRADSRWEG
jgi:hypothetical protein